MLYKISRWWSAIKLSRNITKASCRGFCWLSIGGGCLFSLYDVAVVHAMQLQKIRRNKITDKVDFKRNSLFACLTSRHVVFCWLFVTATCLPDIIPSSVSHSVCQLIPLALWRPSSPCTACFIPPFISDLARLELPCALLNNGYVVLCHRSISMVLMVLKRRKHADRHKKRGDVWCLRKAFGYTRVIDVASLEFLQHFFSFAVWVNFLQVGDP